MDEILDRDPQPEDKSGRPFVISLVCVLEVGILIVFAGYALYIYPRLITDGFFFYTMIRLLLNAGLAAGMWLMKKKAAYMFIGAEVLHQIILLRVDRWTIQTFIFSMIMVALVVSRIDRLK
jgi:hypothetical protein